TRLVADARGALHLVNRIEPLDALDRRFAKEIIVIVGLARAFRVENIFIDGNTEPHRRQVVAGVAPLAHAVEIVVFHIAQNILAPVRHYARTTDHVAIAVADCDHLHAVFAPDDFARAPARQVLVIDIARTAPDPLALVA